MAGKKGVTSLNPWEPLIDMIVKMYTGAGPDFLGSMMQSPPGYTGQMSAPWSPMSQMANQSLMQQARSGGPQAWGQAQNWANQWMQPYSSGVFNPFTQQIESYGQPGMGGGGGGQGSGGTGGMGGGGVPGMGGGGGSGMNPQMMAFLSQIMGQGR
jgi:hypothetical protein